MAQPTSLEADTALPLVGILTVCYNDASRLPLFLESLKQIQYPRFTFTLVDNHSRDASVALVRAGFPEADIVCLDANRGTTGGYNVGIRQLLAAGVDYIMTLAIDVRVAPDCLLRLVEIADGDPEIGAVCPVLFYSDEPNTVQMYGGSLDLSTGNAQHDYARVTDLALLPATHDADYLDGGTMLMKSAVLHKVHGFDEALFIYAEDADLSLRIRAAGYRTVAVRDAWVWHYHRENLGIYPPAYTAFYCTRNRFFLVHKYGPPRARWRLALYILREQGRRFLHYARRGKIRLLRAYLTGVLYGLTNRMGKRGWVE